MPCAGNSRGNAGYAAAGDENIIMSTITYLFLHGSFFSYVFFFYMVYYSHPPGKKP